MINRVFAFAALILLTVSLHAADINNLYQVELPVASQAQDDRNQAIADAFRSMLVKVTGDRNVGSIKALAPALLQSARYVQQYRYRLDDQAVTPTDNPDTAASGGQARLLQVVFDKSAVDRMLRQSGLSVWGSVRPQVLAWVGFEQNRKRNLLIPDTSQELSAALKKAAERRGVPFLLPLMDLDDQAAVSSSDLWGEFEKPIRQASHRYAADLILLVRVSKPAADLWRAKWSLLDNRQTRSWQNQGQQLFALLDDGVQQMADLLAAQYAPAGDGDVANINMRVAGVTGFDDLLRLQEFLQQQELVENFQLRFAQGDKVVLTLKLRGGEQAFVQSLALSGVLTPDEAELAMPSVSAAPTVVAANPDAETAAAAEPQPTAALYEAQLYYRLQ